MPAQHKSLLALTVLLLVLGGDRLLPRASAGCAAQATAERETPVGSEARVEADRWYEIWIDGSRAGWSHEVVTVTDETITTTASVRMALGRADQAVEIRMTSAFDETPEGEPIEVRSEQRLGPTPVGTTYRFGDDGVTAVQTRDGAEHESLLPAPAGEWLPPAAARRYVAQRLASGASKITVRTLDPSNGFVVSAITRSNIAPGRTEIAGNTTECLVADTRTVVGTTPMVGKEWLLADGTVVRSELAVGGMSMVSVASTRERALEDFVPPEMLVSTFVRPDRPITDPRRTTRAVYRLRLAGGALPGLPESAFQRVTALDDGSARVTIDTGERRPAGTPLTDAERETFLAPTTYADAEDELVRTLTDRALADAGDAPEAKAEALRRFVYTHIARKDLGTAFATASEVARSRRGDCTEHAVLLAAMLRAAGIPSRVAVGVIYVERFAGERNVFGYHMWTQAMLDTGQGPAWLDADATLDRRTPFDATHIALATSDLAEGQAVSQLAGIAPLLGTLEIVVEASEARADR